MDFTGIENSGIPGGAPAPLNSFPIRLAKARRVHPNFIYAGARRDVESFVVGITEGDVGYELGRADGTQVSSFRRQNPDAARVGFINISLHVYLHAICNSGSGV